MWRNLLAEKLRIFIFFLWKFLNPIKSLLYNLILFNLISQWLVIYWSKCPFSQHLFYHTCEPVSLLVHLHLFPSYSQTNIHLILCPLDFLFHQVMLYRLFFFWPFFFRFMKYIKASHFFFCISYISFTSYNKMNRFGNILFKYDFHFIFKINLNNLFNIFE